MVRGSRRPGHVPTVCQTSPPTPSREPPLPGSSRTPDLVQALAARAIRTTAPSTRWGVESCALLDPQATTGGHRPPRRPPRPTVAAYPTVKMELVEREELQRAGGGTRTHDLTITRERRSGPACGSPSPDVAFWLVSGGVPGVGPDGVRRSGTGRDAIVGTGVGMPGLSVTMSHPQRPTSRNSRFPFRPCGPLPVMPARSLRAVSSLAEFGESLTVVEGAKL